MTVDWPRIISWIIEAAIVSLIATSSALVTSALYGRKVKADLRKEFESRVNAEKWKVYTGLIDWIGRTPFLPDDAQVSKAMGDLWRHIDLIMLLGSGEVINTALAACRRKLWLQAKL